MTRYLITSALPYINGMKHLGNLVGSMLPADVYARFLRLEGEEVLYICATDEHGTPAEIAAMEEGLDVKTYCDIQYQRQKDVYMRFGLSFDYFGRTSSPQNHELTQHFYKMLNKNGFIEERGIQQIYSLDDQRFLPDRYVTGTCPKCGYERARGDQCENCASLLNPSDLIEPKSTISGSRNLELRESKHLFLKLDTLSPEIEAWVKTNTHWPNLTYSVAMKWLNEGLQPRCITRDLSWGVPVPREGYENKVFYVWFDAPIGYVGATKEWADQDPANRDWKAWWYDADDVYYAQFMAKDNLPFHTIVWPATILGTREPWTMANYIKGFNWLTYYGGKFSTSQGRGVFMDDALEILPPDYWRYFLMSIAPESDDSDFTWDLFATVVNKDLAGTLGNFVNRTLKLVSSRLGNTIPEGGEWGEHEDKLLAQCKESIQEYRTALRNFEFRKAALALKKLWTHGNVYIDARAPWNLLKENPGEGALVLRTCINLIRTYAIASSPFIPFTSETLFDALGMTEEERKAGLDDALNLRALEAGRAFKVPPILFRRLDQDEIETYRRRFAGVEE
ncbi:MAG TPA: methionine--tRNA ligase [Bacillota bacterium]|mgnify:CR=1 FL=1|jgi:methionyl-tRNA synthetase|nr:methionine--tRNA ligase [Candidatus Fermentithermobacillaceae bacterium]HAF66307.1 methionine--tRNA ligase [Clostridiales bacterium UBA9857]HOA70512.1 methionine--tRNA ligase [Bacillota bacterium]HOP71268.1 methionine--tRNA ligase [Bacillota bacterium]HPT35273.1 methionine--tRNA ligase [Bacillota bacterium]